ncbi:GH3 auxin-responsive promoter family protein [Bdellovibrio sp. HCB337]|uniref:GH3 family domain-containing protein n=1 Tax=Bdellovibrio sp. HCB337 TaxID=3394358 RepID=UPI0039A5F5E0
MISTSLIHQGLGFYYSRAEKSFRTKLKNLEQVQRAKLAETMDYLATTRMWGEISSQSYERLADKIPLRDYSEYHSLIEAQRKQESGILCPDVTRYEPTSGSTSARKWIPYSPQFLSDINKAAAVWMGDLYQSVPGVKNGPHYWSLSWLPQELRNLTSSDDSELFPWWQQVFLKNFMAAPGSLALAPSSEAAWRASLAYLFSQKELALISVWSPSFLLKIAEDLQNLHSEIQRDLSSGSWGAYSKDLSSLIAPPAARADYDDIKSAKTPQEFLHKVWPNLALVSSWDSAQSKLWAQDIKSLFPKVAFQGKGLWATEGVVSFPYQNQKILAMESHFFEFKCLASGKVLPSWKLEKDQEVQPILWTSSGFLRYPLQDKMKVTGFIEETPTFEFMGRLQGVDMVGEKMDSATASQILEVLQKEFHCEPICLLAVQNPKPYYLLTTRKQVPDLNKKVENVLQEYHHYKVARELGQLQASRVQVVADIHAFWDKTNKSQIKGQNKIESLRLVETWDLGDN